MKKNILLTGQSGVGKTAIIQKGIARPGRDDAFYTEEIRKRGTRQGFKIIILQGKEGVIAYKGIISSY